MQLTEDDIESLLKGSLRNDRISQKSLYKLFYPYAMSICLRYADNREDASEILNDGFMKIFINLKNFDFTRPFKPWLRKIMVNTAINRFNAKQKSATTSEIGSVSNEADGEKILSGISYNEVIALLQKLSPACRTVFNLYVIEGYTHEEIAKKLNISSGTSKSNLFKAKAQLKDLLKDFFESDYVKAK